MAGDAHGHVHRLALVALCALTFFVGLGSPAITDTDEGFYAEAGREMVESGNWITPHFNYTPRFEKPVLFYWLVASAYVTTGVTETGARVFAALSGLGLVLLAYGVGRRWMDARVGWLAGAIVATSFGAFWMARQSLPDLPLALFMSLATWAAIEAVAVRFGPGERDKTAPERRRWLIAASVAAALAMLTKGPAGVGIPALAVLPLVAWDWRRTSTTVTIANIAMAAGVFLAIAAPWYLLENARNPGYFTRFFIAENFDRFATSRYNEPRPVYYFVPVMLGGLVPWTPFMVLWIAPIVRVVRRQFRPSAIDIRLVLWALVPFLVYSFSKGKQPRYILPCLIPAALLLSRSIVDRAQRAGRDVMFVVAGVGAGAVLAGIGALLLRMAPLFERAQPAWSAAWPIVMVVAGALVVGAAVAAPRRLIPGVVAIASAVSLVAMHRSIMALGPNEPVEVLARVVREQPPGATLCQCGAFGRNLSFYTHMPIVGAENVEEMANVLDRPEPVLAVIDEKRLALVEIRLDRRSRPFRRLADVWYFKPDGIRTSMLIDPRPEMLEHVILISTR